MKLYGELTPWYRLIDPYEDHRDEAEAFTAEIDRLAVPPSPSWRRPCRR